MERLCWLLPNSSGRLWEMEGEIMGKYNMKKYWNESVAARSSWLPCTPQPLKASWVRTCRNMAFLHTQIRIYIYTRACTQLLLLLLLWNTAKESNSFMKNNGIFTSKVTVSKESRKWTKALIVRELLTPGLKKWPQMSNDALSLKVAAAVFHSKLNCQSTLQSSSTINSHLCGKYTKNTIYCLHFSKLD